jgi:hypothetical protein
MESTEDGLELALAIESASDDSDGLLRNSLAGGASSRLLSDGVLSSK